MWEGGGGGLRAFANFHSTQFPKLPEPKACEGVAAPHGGRRFGRPTPDERLAGGCSVKVCCRNHMEPPTVGTSGLGYVDGCKLIPHEFP